jgi:hypothetical protein
MIHRINEQWVVILDTIRYEFDFLDEAIAFVTQHGYAS